MSQIATDDPQGRTAVEQRHAAYFRQLGTQAHLNSFSMKGGVRRRQKLVLELENLQEAMDFSLRMTQHDDAALFALGAMQIYSEQGPFSRAIELADLILSKADLDPQLQIRMLLQQARAHRWAARSEDAKTKLEKAFSIAVKVNDQESEGTVLTQLGEINTHLGAVEEAESNCRRALLLHRKYQNRLQEGVTMGQLGLIYRFHHRLEHTERYEESKQYFEGALKIHQQIGNRAAEGWTHRALGDLCMDHGYRSEGQKNYEAGLHILREVGQRFDEAITMGNLGIYFLEERSLERAKEYFEGSVTLSQQLQINAAAYFMCGLSEVLARLGEHERALELIEQGEKGVRQKESDDRLLGLVCCYRGQVMRCCGQRQAAQNALDEAHAISGRISKGAQFELLQSITRLENELAPL